MEILRAIKAGEVEITDEGKEAYRKQLQWHHWPVRQALTAGFLEETETAKENAEAREAEFRRLVGA